MFFNENLGNEMKIHNNNDIPNKQKGYKLEVIFHILFIYFSFLFLSTCVV